MTSPSNGRPWVRGVLLFISLAIAAFWVWALFFPPSKQSVAKVDDDAWAARAESICRSANEKRDELTDLRRVEDVGPSALTDRADLIDEATSIVDAMITDVLAAPLSDPEDQSIVDTWAEMYRTLIDDRRIYTQQLRDGVNGAFAESAIEGAPISDYINDFTVANRMKSCSAPLDLAV